MSGISNTARFRIFVAFARNSWHLSDPKRRLAGLFGRFTGARGSFSDIGGRTNLLLVGRVEW